MKSFLRSMGVSNEDAEDLTQEVFAGIYNADQFPDLDPTKGRMRNYLMTAAKHRALNFHRHRTRDKRGGTATHLPFEEELIEPGVKDISDREFDRRWAHQLIELTTRSLREEYESRGREVWFQALFPRLTETSSQPTYEDLAKGLKSSTSAVKAAIHRMKQKYQKILRSEVAKTVATEDEIDSELQALFNALGKN